MGNELFAVKRRFGIVGNSEKLNHALNTAIRVAPTDLTVLIAGESGVGKEAFSKVVHHLSPRKHNNFMAINCGAIPEGTINSELFGHEKGAFTGAAKDRLGYFETVDGGTMFLDEIGEMPLDTQAFLLRILESGEFMRVGTSKVLKTDVRIVAASNKDLFQQVKKGKFREDLFYRLNTVPIHIPPLRERKEDILLLFRKFASDFAEKYRIEPIRLSAEAALLIQNYTWPGNIRQLKNVAEQLSILAEERIMTPEIILSTIPNIKHNNLPTLVGTNSATDFQEQEMLYKLLFEMKKDMTDLKSLVFELIRNNDLNVSDLSNFNKLETSFLPAPTTERNIITPSVVTPHTSESNPELNTILIDDDSKQQYANSEVVEESLSIENMEKELIRKALKKHKNRRRDAADDLGISERTLYRKIKQYDL